MSMILQHLILSFLLNLHYRSLLFLIIQNHMMNIFFLLSPFTFNAFIRHLRFICNYHMIVSLVSSSPEHHYVFIFIMILQMSEIYGYVQVIKKIMDSSLTTHNIVRIWSCDNLIYGVISL